MCNSPVDLVFVNMFVVRLTLPNRNEPMEPQRPTDSTVFRFASVPTPRIYSFDAQRTTQSISFCSALLVIRRTPHIETDPWNHISQRVRGEGVQRVLHG